MKLLVCGGREFHDYKLLDEKLTYIRDTIVSPQPISMIITGGANGADRLASEWAENNSIHYAEVPAMWTVYGKSAGFIRNSAMLELIDKTDLVVAFPGGPGTNNMIRTSLEFGIQVAIIDNSGGLVLADSP